MKTLNLGILAHVDAGKTTLTERLLFAAGVLAAPGSVDAGDTLTDSLALERARGITIKTAVASFAVKDVPVNLIDTPGHPDFIAEVERVLCVLDGAVLVVSAVEGVQAQTRILFRALRRLGVPTLIFINKIDRTGARPQAVLQEIGARLDPAIVPMGRTSAAGTREARVLPFRPEDQDFTVAQMEVLSEHDDDLLAAFVDGRPVRPGRLHRALRRQSGAGVVFPVFFGSAITGAGVDALMDGIAGLLPAAEPRESGEPSGTVFKVDRGPGGQKVAYVRLFAGSIAVRDRISYGNGKRAKVTALKVFTRGGAEPAAHLSGGQIGTLIGLPGVRIGDPIGTDGRSGSRGYFAPPTLETVVVPAGRADKGRLQTALSQLAEQDPLINLRQDDVRGELYLSLYGEVQKEVIQSTLAEEYGLHVDFRQTTTICIERPIGSGAAAEFLGAGAVSPHQNIAPDLQGEPNPFLATVGLRIEPAPAGTGIRYGLAQEVHGTMPPAFFKAAEETVIATMEQGLQGWQVTDAAITLTHTGYVPRQGKRGQSFNAGISTSAGDFRNLTPLVLMAALREAGTVVCEPMHRFHLEIPEDALGAVLLLLGRLGAVPGTPELTGAVYRIEGDLPAAAVHEMQQTVPGLTRGEGVLESAFDHYRPMAGAVPRRPRTDLNPLNRKEYLQLISRRIQTAQVN